jgi:hypothetical protein
MSLQIAPLSAARRVLGVKPIVISGVGHANIVTSMRLSVQTLLSEVCDGEAKVAQ